MPERKLLGAVIAVLPRSHKAAILAVIALILAGSIPAGIIGAVLGPTVKNNSQQTSVAKKRATQAHRLSLQVRSLANRLDRSLQRINRSLCSFRTDLAKRAAQTESFLHDHPAGIPGVPNALLRTQLVNQKATLKSLSDLPCQ